jgi:hypothetical protein
VKRSAQIANYADFCNACGNCDTFCPEYGGPYIQKPGFFSSLSTYRHAAPTDGFLLIPHPGLTLLGRIRGIEYSLTRNVALDEMIFTDSAATVILSATDHAIKNVAIPRPLAAFHHVDMWIYHVMRTLLDGVLHPAHVHQLNAGFLEAAETAVATP